MEGGHNSNDGAAEKKHEEIVLLMLYVHLKISLCTLLMFFYKTRCNEQT